MGQQRRDTVKADAKENEKKENLRKIAEELKQAKEDEDTEKLEELKKQ